MAIFTYAFHNSTSSIDTAQPLHIVVHHYFRNREDEETERRGGYWWDSEGSDYGSTVESECGLKGILIKTDVDAITEEDYDLTMGLKEFHEKYGGIKTVNFFMPPNLRNSMQISIAEGQIPKERICDKCKENLEATLQKLRQDGHEV